MDAMKLGETLWKVHLEHVGALDKIVERSHTRGESGVLLYLYHMNRPMYPGELTEKLGLTTGRVANILRVLEEAGMVRRAPNATDKRRVLVTLTPPGEAAAREQNLQAVAFYTRIIDRLSPEEAQRLLDTTRHIVEIMEEE